METPWFKYLSKSKHGYKFLINREKQISVLREILFQKAKYQKALSKVVNNF